MDKDILLMILYMNLILAFALGSIYLSKTINIQFHLDMACNNYGYQYYDSIQRDCYYKDYNYSVIRENGKVVDLKINSFKHYSAMDKGAE